MKLLLENKAVTAPGLLGFTVISARTANHPEILYHKYPFTRTWHRRIVSDQTRKKKTLDRYQEAHTSEGSAKLQPLQRLEGTKIHLVPPFPSFRVALKKG